MSQHILQEKLCVIEITKTLDYGAISQLGLIAESEIYFSNFPYQKETRA